MMTVSLFCTPKRAQASSEFGDQLAQFVVGQLPLGAIFGDPDEGQLVAVGAVSMTVQRVEGDVGLPTHEPLVVGVVPLHHLLPGFEPLEAGSPFTPEGFRVRQAARPFALQVLQIRLFLEPRRGVEALVAG